MSKMRRKIITTGAITSRKLASLTHAAERLYWRVYMASDNYGTMSADPWDVWHMSCPGVNGMTEDTVSACIRELENAGLIVVWTNEDDASEYLHIVGHDTHQSADFLRKRGSRQSPTPPSLPTDAVRAAKGSEGQGTASQAEVCPRGSKGQVKESVSVSTSTTNELERSLDAISADDEATFIENVTTLLSQVVDQGKAAHQADSLLRRALRPYKRDGRTLGKFPLSQWLKAVERAIEIGGSKQVDDLGGLIYGLVPDVELEPISVTPEAAPDGLPASEIDRMKREIAAQIARQAGVA